jgi:hypothetical protein
LFSTLSRIIATLALILGVAQLALGVAIAWGAMGPREQALARYTSETTTGAVINEAVLVIAVALALGTLGEIGAAVRKWARG